ncbi:RNA-binding protein 44 [Lycodopsis pacificus]
MVIEKPRPNAIRSFLLERSVFHLVACHKFLSLTDPKLLGWYLSLPAEDRTVIQDGGGFQQFLLRHPALELTLHHVHVKCHVSSVRPAQPAVMSNRPTHVSQFTLSGATKCGSDLERPPNTVRETLDLLGFSNSEDVSQKHPAAFNSFVSPPDPVEENSPEGRHDHMACGNGYTEGEDEASLSFGDQSDCFHSIMENDESILACLTSDDVKAQNSGVHSGPVHTDGEALAANSETSKSDQSVAKMTAAEHRSSLMPRVATADIAVGTELPPCTSAVTQTERPETADKHVNTEVHMVDLDYLAEEFIKMKKVLEKLRGQKEEMKRSSQEPQKPKTPGEENGCPADQSTNGSQLSQTKMENSKARRAVAVVPQDGDATHEAHKPEEKKTTAERQELNTCEAWYDAEENLQHAGPAAAAKTGREPTVKDETKESASEEGKSSVLFVSNLPGNVTESDVMLCFEKYRASQVSISAFKNDVRVAIVKVSGPRSAEAAVRELRGCCMQGHALHVQHINGAGGGSQRPASASIRGPESSEDSTGPQTSKTERKLISQPLLGSSMKHRKVVCVSPTAKGTFVPQHYGTMGSFDTLMAELSQRHPDVGRQRIVDALVELNVKHRGVLSGLPLSTIREMTSELLTRPAARDAAL